MQTIQLKKFGSVLVSRPAGMEAFNAIRPQLKPDIPVEIDFDEFLTHLTDFNGGKVELLPTKNASVLAALPVLGQARKDLVAATVLRALKRMQDSKWTNKPKHETDWKNEPKH